MSKAVHWQVPFASLKGVQYRVDIYADGECSSPVVLTGGSTPFTTDEDNSDDYFTPVRSQTGNLTVIDDDGTLMETLMPKDNVDRPVRLVRVSDSNVMWQGFLSCEAYSQDYTARAQELTLNVNSVLAAMESILIPNEIAGFMTINELLRKIFRYQYEKAGIDGMVARYYIPKLSKNILHKYIDTTVLFEQKEQDNENSVTYTVSGISMKDALERICTYMGWVLREDGAYVYMIDEGDEMNYYFYYAAYSTKYHTNGTVVTKGSINMSDNEWRGTGHEKEVRQGAKSVEVVAKVDEYNLDIKLPECPVGDLEEEENTSGVTSVLESGRWSGSKKIRILANNNPTFNNKYEFYYKYVDFENNTISEGTFIGTYHDSIPYPSSTSGTWFVIDKHKYVGAYMAKLGIGNPETSPVNIELSDGLYISGNGSMPNISSQYKPNIPVFKCSNLKKFAASKGFIVINMEAIMFASGDDRLVIEGSAKKTDYMNLSLYFAGKWWNGTAWQTDETTFRVKIKGGKIESNYTTEMGIKENDGYLLTIDEFMTGDLYVRVHSLFNGSYIDYTATMQDYTNEAFITRLDVGYLSLDSDKYSYRSENHYFKLLDMNFSEEVSINTDIASDMNNKPSPSIVMNSETEPMTTLTYADGTIERPEKHLLNRLTEYYKAVRRKITLEIERPNVVMPLARFLGFDKRWYLPLSESRNWRTDTSKVTCYESSEDYQPIESVKYAGVEVTSGTEIDAGGKGSTITVKICELETVNVSVTAKINGLNASVFSVTGHNITVQIPVILDGETINTITIVSGTDIWGREY